NNEDNPRRNSFTQNARGASAAAALSDHAGAGHPEREKHGSNRAESSRDWSSGDRAADFRAHHRSSRGERSGAKASEMASGRDRSSETMWTKLAPDGAAAENPEGFFCNCRGRRVACTRLRSAADTAAATEQRFRVEINRFASIRRGAFKNGAG